MELLKIGLNELQENQDYITELVLNENITNIYMLVDEVFKSAEENGGLVSAQVATKQIKKDYDLTELMEQIERLLDCDYIDTYNLTQIEVLHLNLAKLELADFLKRLYESADCEDKTEKEKIIEVIDIAINTTLD
ncbi:hypothetical protein [Dialister micraerophilus]|uniref:Uncharacterized protein n=1 Tax=Dialister micraerophilus UPII 345-E TaxID=910314 RepID=E4LA30_9FIRM|nr:hypothetical protein [Dialister micraerophilus]EFR42326.1 hypothetical protein HMPREF9220_0597 [Dialister micraerophilus UPII 345-E]